MDGQFGDSTRSVKAAATQGLPGQPLAQSPVPASAYHLDPDESASFDSYGRSSNPTWRALESALAALEGAASALTFSSGMGAITSVLRTLVKPGATLVVPADGYYQVRKYATESLAPQGINVVAVPAAEMCAAAAEADVVLAESPVNPTLDVVDLHQLATTCRGRGTTLVVDNTAATPFGQRPLSLGADLVVASLTKGLAGHSDVVAGYVAGSNPELMADLQRERLLAGVILGPFEAWLALRSIGTAGLRFDRQCHSALAVALMLRGHPSVKAVRYPGLPDDPAHEVARRNMKRFGSLIAVELADAAAVHRLVERSALLVAATSFGGIHTCIDRRARWGDAVPDGFARISLGIEDTDDLLTDFEQALR
jgi:cystathionine gamma-lyase